MLAIATLKNKKAKKDNSTEATVLAGETGLVRMAKLESMLAAINDMDEATMRRLHIRCVNEVKKINGILTMEEAVRYQRSNEE